MLFVVIWGSLFFQRKMVCCEQCPVSATASCTPCSLRKVTALFARAELPPGHTTQLRPKLTGSRQASAPPLTKTSLWGATGLHILQMKKLRYKGLLT